jgi:hypothetical protein
MKPARVAEERSRIVGYFNIIRRVDATDLATHAGRMVQKELVVVRRCRRMLDGLLADELLGGGSCSGFRNRRFSPVLWRVERRSAYNGVRDCEEPTPRRSPA